MTALYIFLGGGVGALSRWGLGKWLNVIAPPFPLGVFFCNLLGCFLIGFFAGSWPKPTALQTGLMTGLLGGFTTFSTFSLDTLKLWQSGNISLALINSLGSLIGGALLAWLGYTLARS